MFSIPSHRTIGLVALAGLGLLVVLTLAGFLLVPVLVQWQLEKQLELLLDRPSRVASVSFNPLRGRLIVKGLQMEDRVSGSNAAAVSPLVSVERLEAHISWRSVLERAPVIDRILITTPQISLRRLADGRYNVADWIDRFVRAEPAAQAAVQKPDSLTKFLLANIELHNGAVRFEDALHGQQHVIDQITLGVPFLSSLPIYKQIYVEPRLAARVNNSPFDLKGRSRPFAPDKESNLDFTLDEIDLARYVEYVPAELPVSIERLPLSLSVRVGFLQPPNASAAVVLRGEAKLRNAALRERNGRPLFVASEVRLGGLTARPLETFWDVETLTLVKPVVHVQRLAGDRGWFDSFLIDRQPRPDKAPLRWRLGRLLVESGLVNYRDEQFQPQVLAQVFNEVNAEVSGLSSDPTAEVTFKAANTTPLDETSTIEGRLRANPFEMDGQFSLSDLKLAPKWWIAQPYVNLELLEGQADTRTRFQISVNGKEVGVRLTELEFDLKRLVLRQTRDRLEFLRLPSARIRGAGFDLIGRQIDLGHIESTDTRLELRRDEQGQLNVAQLARTAASSGSPGVTARPPLAASDPSPWTVTLASINAQRQQIEFKDSRAGKAGDLSVRDLTLRAEKLSTANAVTGKASLQGRLNRDGRFSMAGPLSLQPLVTKLQIELQDVSLLPLPAYLGDSLNAMLTSGQLQARGELALERLTGSARGPVAAAAPVIRYRGSVAVTQLGLVDKSNQRDIVRWKSLQATAIELLSQPLAVKVGEVLSEDLQARLILDGNGRLNLLDLWRHSPAKGTADSGIAPGEPAVARPDQPGPSSAAPEDGIASKLQFGRLVLRNGSIDFTDQFVNPGYRARLAELEGAVTQITPQQAGKVDLRGRLSDGGRVEIDGEINPLTANLYLDLQARASDVEMPGLSTYSKKYLGYGIEKGKLSATLKYALKDRKLAAENRVVLDQLTFGEAVDSPTAIKAPVLFAVALLKDRNGVIDVNLPIGGTLDDPQFSVGGIIWQVIGNLIVKAVTAPFSLLAGLIGGNENELSNIQFDAGATRLDEAAVTRLRALAKGLAQRPGVKIELTGRIDPQRDGQALRVRRLERLLKAQKLRETVGAGESADALDRIVLEPGDEDRLLKLLFEAAAIEAPRDARGRAQTVTREDMRAMLLARQEVSDNDLLALAVARARSTKLWLENDGGIDAARIFLVEPSAGRLASNDGNPSSGVDLALK